MGSYSQDHTLISTYEFNILDIEKNGSLNYALHRITFTVENNSKNVCINV